MKMLLYLALSLPVVWLVSMLVESLRRIPPTPDTLAVAPHLSTDFMDVDGTRLRYLKVGNGPTVVLLHTLRTQLDLFYQVIDDLRTDHTVYAVDYPGHGYSDIPDADYDADFFAHTTSRFLDALGVESVTLCGISIGASIALILGGRQHPKIAQIVAVNPNDFAQGRGITRASIVAAVFVWCCERPLLGEIFMRLRNFIIFRAVMNGGVADPSNIPAALMREMYVVGDRPGHYQAFLKLLRHLSSWETVKPIYRDIRVPTTIIWGSDDWARPDERDEDTALVPHAKVETLSNAGHFLSFDAAEPLATRIREATGALEANPNPST